MSRIHSSAATVMQDHESDPRFAPPDDRRFAAPRDDPPRGGTHRLRFVLLLIGLVVSLLTGMAPRFGARSRVVAMTAAVAAFLLVVAEFALRWTVAAHDEEGGPYSQPPTVTR